MFVDAVFNETVTIVEVEEGFDGETYVYYILYPSSCNTNAAYA